jgi:hypothetical protein
MGPKPIVLPNWPTKYSHKNSSDFTLSPDFPFPVCTHEHKSSCRSETNMQQTVKPEVPLREHPMALSIYNSNPVITTGTAIIS